MSRILLIETTGQACSAAIVQNDQILCVRENHEGLSHATLLSVFIDEMFKELKISGEELDAVTVSMGPGSYTGIRIGVATAKGICFAVNKPLIAINTLASMASGMRSWLLKDKNPLAIDPETLYCPMVDARRMEVYLALLNQQFDFASEIKAVILDETVFSDVLTKQKIVFFGSGSEKAKSVIHHPNAIFIPHFLNSALHLHQFALNAFEKKEFEDTAYFEPLYLKDFVATTPKKKI